ncbi:23S rRNA (pseudouridine(1915)-N(3))-methyltransferase RlmH [Fulvimarina sp. 2208YS6-2-32]|uniref:Ribosomal RNA large subunit methyltransferase H n=1 Tax=Fulvimarina uroteuthidis TaxID=3098149 RepID=A0ABU5I5M3_9HYPH|nr:23S rRNA (pseudouridine(1915)-N(3))-methyltransferase RlmH [Fulvimarina sp. 2208YS6-2-32]MDY8110109.1 23S rRNA (pseudouridine(1915)-N(3))-methyltransferase RlmH [Fulvimarina sp. 2208YS6-2-32]
MRIAIAAIGKMKRGPEQDLFERYVDRMKKAGPQIGLEWRSLSEFPESREASSEARKRDEAARLRAVLEDGTISIVLDERGKTLSSEEFADALKGWRDAGIRDCTLVIGGPDGHERDLRQAADLTLSLGRLTFPHQIARILIAEQLYRAVTILSGHPYHRS